MKVRKLEAQRAQITTLTVHKAAMSWFRGRSRRADDLWKTPSATASAGPQHGSSPGVTSPVHPPPWGWPATSSWMEKKILIGNRVKISPVNTPFQVHISKTWNSTTKVKATQAPQKHQNHQ